MGPNGPHDVPKSGFFVFGKKVFAFWGDAMRQMDVPKLGFLISGKKIFAFLGHAAKCGMSIFRHFFFSENKQSHF
jgi:hypothetical protein